jgi:hypothetical protein
MHGVCVCVCLCFHELVSQSTTHTHPPDICARRLLLCMCFLFIFLCCHLSFFWLPPCSSNCCCFFEFLPGRNYAHCTLSRQICDDILPPSRFSHYLFWVTIRHDVSYLFHVCVCVFSTTSYPARYQHIRVSNKWLVNLLCA